MTLAFDPGLFGVENKARKRIQLAIFWMVLALSWHLSYSASDGEEPAPDAAIISCDDPHLVFSPYVWKRWGQSESSRAEATMPGAYFRASIAETSRVELLVDGHPNLGCPKSSLPQIEVSVDDGEFQTLTLKLSPNTYSLLLADALDPSRPHTISVYFKAADLTQERWHSTKAHLCIAGLVGDASASAVTLPRCQQNAIGFGDSITEGVGVGGLFKSWQSLDVNNARTTWLPIVAAAFGCEYGQLGSGGQGMVFPHQLPPLGATWDRFDVSASRLVNGKLDPPPDFVFCLMGTNDGSQNIASEYVEFLTSLRKACPEAQVFCIVPPLGVHAAEISDTVDQMRNRGDLSVHLIDTANLRKGFGTGKGATQLAHDGVHPTLFGQALFGASIARETQRILLTVPKEVD